MFARQPRHQVIAVALALFTTFGMLGAVDTRAMHGPAEVMMATAPATMECPVNG